MNLKFTQRIVLLIAAIVGISAAGMAQTTYYWVGGAAGSITSDNSWNTNLDGSGSNRAMPANNDVLIFNGSNIGGSTPATGTVTPDFTGSFTVGRLLLSNAANVVLRRNADGTSTITIAGDGTAAHDVMVAAGCTLTITTNSGFGCNMVVGEENGGPATASISGTLNILDNGAGTARMTARESNSIFMESGAIVNSNVTQASSYPFGSASNTPAAAVFGVVFKAGAVCRFLGGNSVQANTSNFFPILWLPGSTLEMHAPQPSGLFGSKFLANVKVMPGVNITLTDNTYGIDSLIISNTASFRYRTTGTLPVKGSIINEGTFGAAPSFTSSNLVLIANGTQSLSGNGTWENLASMSIGTDAIVTVDKNIALSGTSITSVTGKINTKTNELSGTARFQLRGANTAASMATLTRGSVTITLNGSTAYNAANVSIGCRVTGEGIAPNTYVISTSSGSFSFNISNPALLDKASFTGNITLTNDAATLETAHAGGVDGTILMTGTKTFSTGSNYIFNGATVTPFTSSADNAAGNVTFNAAATTNKQNQQIDGLLTLGTGKLTIRATDTLTINGANMIMGTPFSASKYIATQVDGAKAGVLWITGMPVASYNIPVGSAARYLPAVLTPAETSSFAISVFEGVTTEGTPNGTAFTAAQKDRIVNAVWHINRSSGSGTCGMQLGWDAALEGAAFSGFANDAIGIARHDGGNWGIVSGTGNNSTNIATSSFSNFSSFSVGEVGVLLPVIFKSANAIAGRRGVDVSWDVANEQNSLYYAIERGTNLNNFVTVGTVSANQSGAYSFTDPAALNGVALYRIRHIAKDAVENYSKVLRVTPGSRASISVYPNPASASTTISGLAAGDHISLMNAAGSIMAQQVAGSAIIQLNLSRLPNGVYMIKVVNADGQQQLIRIAKQ